MATPEEPGDARRGEGAKGEDPDRRRISLAVIWLVVILGLWALWHVPVQLSAPRVTYTQLKELIRDKKVARVTIAGDQIKAKLRQRLAIRPSSNEAPVEVDEVASSRIEDPKLLEDLQAAGTEVEIQSVDNTLLALFLNAVLPIIVLVVLVVILIRRFSPQRQAAAFARSKVKLSAEKETKITFADVAGIDEAKEELKEIIEFLRDAAPFRKLGARIPQGVLLAGPPGTGKTLLARAVAGEANVPFLSLTGSDFVEMFAGVGAARVRDLFDQAQRQAPAIVFIDELDALGKVRGFSMSGADNEREQTLNQLLSEMDGFAPNSGVVIIAATNRPDVLDPALLRPGRFDRQVVVDRPDVVGREAILVVHAKKVKLAPEVDLKKVAKATPGFVGADLANVINEAALLAGRRKRDAVLMKDVEEAIERNVAGLEKKRRLMSASERERVALHESGHALLALTLPNADPVQRVSIIPRGVAALGYTLQLPTEERHILTRSELEDRIGVALGGRAAERLCLGDTSTGASDDLERALRLARHMVRDFGMTERFGPVAFGGERRPRFLEAPGAQGEESGARYSEETAREIDVEIRRILGEAEQRVDDVLRKREAALRAIAGALMEREVIDHEELVRIATANGAPPVAKPSTPEQETRRALVGERG